MANQNSSMVRLKEPRNKTQVSQKSLGLRIGGIDNGIDINSANSRINH